MCVCACVFWGEQKGTWLLTQSYVSSICQGISRFMAGVTLYTLLVHGLVRSHQKKKVSRAPIVTLHQYQIIFNKWQMDVHLSRQMVM